MSLLGAVGNDRAMERLLGRMMDRAQAEFCAFYTARGSELLYLIIESRELTPLVPDIREKLKRAYRMFTNEPGPDAGPLERVSVRKSNGNVAYLLGGSRIESYFLVPVTFGSKVRGVLYFGSVRKEAFGRNDITEFRSLADEGDESLPLMFRVGGDRELFEKLLDALPHGAALVSGDGAVVAANAAFTEILGLGGSLPESLAEIAQASPFNLAGVWDEFRVLKRNLVDRMLVGVCVPERSLAVSWTALDDLSEEIGSLVLIRDESALREQAEAREELVATVAHELRTPLTALRNSLAILAASGTDRFLGNALRTVDRLGRLVDGLIDVSAARAGERAITLEPYPAQRFLEDASILFAEPMRKKEIVFTIRAAGTVPEIVVDRDRIEQVIQNLLANSMRHVPAGGEVCLSVAPCRSCASTILPAAVLSRVPGARFMDISVRDSGSGIPEEVARRVNQDAGFADRPARASRGLGLHIARRLARQHGGALEIEGSVARGSAVHIYLPADASTARLVARYRAAEARFDEMLSKGLSPAVFCIEKDSPAAWSDVARGMEAPVEVDPARPEGEAGGILLWPLSEELAVALVPGSAMAPAAGLDRQASRPAPDGGAGGAGSRSASAESPREGASFAVLLSLAAERLGSRSFNTASKGERE